jgi:hypothetical protein
MTTPADELTWRARIEDFDGLVHGAGVGIDSRRVLTCAHVIASASSNAEAGTILVSFPAIGPERSQATLVSDGWLPRADLAVLALPQDVDMSRPVLRPAGPAGGRTVRLLGYSTSRPEGVWARGQLLGPAGAGGEWTQVAGLSAHKSRTSTDFSGAGVVDDASGAVIGLIVASDTTGNAFMMPLEAIASHWPPLLDLMSDAPSAAGPREKRPSAETVHRLVTALLAIPGMADSATRRELFYLLPTEISASIPRGTNAYTEVVLIVQTCMRYPDGMANLLKAVRQLEGDNPATLAFARQVMELQ